MNQQHITCKKHQVNSVQKFSFLLSGIQFSVLPVFNSHILEDTTKKKKNPKSIPHWFPTVTVLTALEAEHALLLANKGLK